MQVAGPVDDAVMAADPLALHDSAEISGDASAVLQMRVLQEQFKVRFYRFWVVAEHCRDAV